MISYGVYDLIVMPPGSQPAMPRPPFLQRLGVALSIAGFVFDIGKMIQIFTPGWDEETTALWDVGITYFSGLSYGTNYLFERPHPDLPPMVTLNQDVLVTASDLGFAAAAKYVIGPGVGGAVGNAPGAGTGYIAGLGVDIATTGFSAYYDWNRTFGDWPMQMSIGVTIQGRLVVLWWPQKGDEK